MSENPVYEDTVPNGGDERGRIKLEQGKTVQQLEKEKKL